MNAYIAIFDGEEWQTLIHGKTRGEAKSRFMRCEPSGVADHSYFNSIRLRRLPAWDNRPFIDGDEVRALFSSEERDENGDEIPDPFINDCDCELCKAHHE